MAIEMLKGPQAANSGSAGKFDLPHDFNRQKWAAEWVLERDVEGKRQREKLVGIPATADGWEPYKDPSKNKIIKVVVREGTYVLMVRPKEIQGAVNIMYGNLGKTQALAEQEGAVSSNGLQDPGMLSDRKLRSFGIETGEVERPDDQFRQTPIPHIGMPSNQHVDATRTT